jgi:hypothetical protein
VLVEKNSHETFDDYFEQNKHKNKKDFLQDLELLQPPY